MTSWRIVLRVLAAGWVTTQVGCGGSGSTGGSNGSGVIGTPACVATSTCCATIKGCCSSLESSQQGECNSDVAEGFESACALDLEDWQSDGECGG